MLPKRSLKMAGILFESELKFQIDLPPEIQRIHQAFKSNARKLYVVGGAVRDALLGKKPKDFDLTTDALPKEVERILVSSGIKSFPKGESFGVISAIINGEEFEIATFREESYEDGEGRRPTSVQYSNMENDVIRRDLTINALYYDIDRKTIIDLVGGIEDLKNKRIHPVGNPMERFEEDRLRVLRALRFAHRFGSQLNKDTIDAIKYFNKLPGVSGERIRVEFLSGLKTAVDPVAYLEDYNKFGLFPKVFPNVKINTNFIKGLNDTMLVIAWILLPNDIDKVLNSLVEFKASNEEKNNIKFLLLFAKRFQNFNKLVLIPNIDGKWIIPLRKSLDSTSLSKEQVIEWAKMNNIDQNITNKFISFVPTFSASDFPEIKPGPELGKAISVANAQKFIDSL